MESPTEREIFFSYNSLFYQKQILLSPFRFKQRGQVFSASATIVERFGLFTIIVLAENILGTVTGVSEVEHKQTAVWSTFMLSILIVFLLWSLYFEMTSEQEARVGIRSWVRYKFGGKAIEP